MEQRATVEKACRKLMDSHGLESWRLDFVDNPPDYAGLCDSEARTIYISAQCLDEAEDICLHEIAHALRGRFGQHGPDWADLAWRLAGCPAGGTGSCPEPKQMSDLIGSITYHSLLLNVLKEAKEIGVVDEKCKTLTVRGGRMSSAMDGYDFCFYQAYGDVVIYAPSGSWYVEAHELEPEIVSAFVAVSGSERMAEEVKAVNELIDGLQGASLRGFRRRRTPG